MQRFILLVALLLVLALGTQAAEKRHARLSARLTTPAQPTASRVAWYSRWEVPEGWVQLDAASSNEQLTFTVIVAGSNGDELERRFWSRSDPDSDDFGEWMTNADIEQLVAPSTADLKQLYDTLAEHGIAVEQVVSHGDSFDITATVQQASSLFDTRFYHFQHSATSHEAIRQWGDYSLPAAIAEQTELILGVHTFPTSEQRLRMRARRAEAREQARAASAARDPPTPGWVPQALAAVYGVPFPIAPLAYSEVGAAVIEWEEQTYSADDLVYFSNQTAVPLAAVDPSRIIGHDNVTGPGVEASLDIQWLEGLNPGSTPWFWLMDQPDAWSDAHTARTHIHTQTHI